MEPQGKKEEGKSVRKEEKMGKRKRRKRRRERKEKILKMYLS